MRTIHLKRATFLTLCLLAAALTARHLGAQAASQGGSEGQAVHALFDPTSPARGPFPSDRFTARDRSHNTGRRVNLPKPDCGERPSDCEDVDVINTLDGFNLQPRLSVPFDGPIDVNSVTGETVFLISLGSTLGPRDGGGSQVGINQVVWDPGTNTLHVESDELLDQHTRYLLVVTRGVRDRSGRPVAASAAFRRFVLTPPLDLFFGGREGPACGWWRDCALSEYRRELVAALGEARRAGMRESEVVSASVFTTQSATAILEKIRNQIKAATPEPADFDLGPDGMRTVFALNDVTGISWRQQTGTAPTFNVVNFDLAEVRAVPGAVGRIAFGKYSSPDYEVHPGEYIPPVGTRTGTPVVQGMSDVFFNLVLPTGTPPPGGWPVAIAGHGGDGSKQGFTMDNTVARVAAALADHGIATIHINVVGHGFGPLGTLTVNRTTGGPITFSAGGRGIDQDGDGVIGSREGIRSAPPRTITDDSDGFRQTVADLMRLVRVIEVGVDVDGDASQDLNPSRIYYFGQSLGGMFGTVFLAVEPNVPAGVITAAGGPRTSRALTTSGDRPLYGSFLAGRTPSLLNTPGVISVEGVPIAGLLRFNENLPLRDGVPLAFGLADGTIQVIQSPVINTVAGAMEIQRSLENTEWVMQPGNPVVYSRCLRKSPLDGVPAKSVLIQFAKGDQAVPNPATTAMLRAGDLADRATFYRHDLASAENPLLPKPGHGFMVAAGRFGAIALGAQEQMARFFASDGTVIIHPEPARFFEVPISSPLPEGLNFIP